MFIEMKELIEEIKKIIEYLEKKEEKKIHYIEAASIIGKSPSYAYNILKMIAVKAPSLFYYDNGWLIKYEKDNNKA